MTTLITENAEMALQNYIEYFNDYKEEEVLSILTMLLLAAHHFHNLDIIHRNITSSNILTHKLPDGFRIIKVTGFSSSYCKSL